MLCGITSILFSLSGRIDLAPFPIYLGAIFDFLDGFVARLLKQQGELGKQLDSLADIITFGVAPGIFMLIILINSAHVFEFNPTEFHQNFIAWIQGLTSGESIHLLPLVALLIPALSLFRLAKFNLDTRQSTSFIGLPTPANTLFFTTFALVIGFNSVKEASILANLLTVKFMIVCILVMSYLLIAELPLFALKFKDFKWQHNQTRFSFLLLTLLIIPTLKIWSIMVVILLYILLSMIENYFTKKKKNEIQS